MPSRPPIQSPPKPSTATEVTCVSSAGGAMRFHVLPLSDESIGVESEEAKTRGPWEAIVYQTCPCGSVTRVQLLPESALATMPAEVAAKSWSPSRLKAKTVPSKGFGRVFLTGALTGVLRAPFLTGVVTTGAAATTGS